MDRDHALSLALWERFSAQSHTLDAFTSFAQWPETGRYLTFLIEVPDERLAVLAEQCAGSLATAAVPRQWLHITVQEVGFDVVAAPMELMQAAERAFSSRSPFPVEIGPVNAFPDAVMAEVSPREPLAATRRALWRELPALRGHGGSPDAAGAEGGMIPHVSLVYFDGGESVGEVAQVLSSYRTINPIQFEVRQIVLAAVAQPRRPHFEWEVVERWNLADDAAR